MKDVIKVVEDVFRAHEEKKVVMPTKITLDLGESGFWPNYNAFINIDNPYVSNFHAKLVLTNCGKIKILDCGSRNGTYLNNDFIQIKGDTCIFPNDKIYLCKNRKIGFELTYCF